MASLGDLSVTVGASIDGFEKSMGTVSQRLNAIDREASRAFSGFEKVGQRLSTIGASLTGAITLPLLGAASVAGKFAADFDLGMRQVTSLLGGATQKEFAALSQATLQLSRDMGIDAVKATGALYEAISAGIPAENAIDFIRVASVAAIAGLTDTKVAVDALTTIIAAYGLETTEAKAVSDAMFQAVNIGKFQFEDLAKAIGPAAQQASNLGISYQELLAATATLSLTSGGVSIAVTQVESAMRALLDPSNQMKAALHAIGFETGSAATQSLGLEGTLEALRKTTGGNAEAFNALFGRIEGANAGLGLTGPKALKAAQDFDTMRHAADGLGASQKAADEVNKSTTRQFEILSAALKVTAIEMGVALLPAINSLLQSAKPLTAALADAVQWFTALPQPVQTGALALAGLAAAAGPVILVAGQLISGFAAVLPAITSLGGAMTSFAAQAATMATGTGTIATALTALQSAAVLTAGVFVGWQLGSWAYAQIPGFKALGDAVAESLLKIPGVEALLFKLTGVTGATKTAFDSSAGAIKAQEDALGRLGIVLNKEGISTEEYAKRLRETVQQQIAMASQTGKTDSEVKKSAKTSQDAAAGTRVHGDALKETEMKARAFADLQPVLAAKIRIVEGEYRRNIEELARLQLAMERGELGLGDFAGATERLAVDLGSLGTAVQNLPQMPGFTGHIAELDAIGAAYGRLGITTAAELKGIAERHLADFGTIKASGIATAAELEAAWLKWLEAAAVAARQSGEDIPIEIEGLLAGSTEKTKASIEEQKTLWDGFGTSVSTVITNFAQDISKSLWDGDVSWGQKGKDLLKSLGESVTSLFIEPATKAISGFITGTIKDLLSGNGLGGVAGMLKDIGGGIAGLFGGGSSGIAGIAGGGAGAIGDASNAVGDIVGAGGSAGGAASTATQAAGIGFQGIANLVTGFASAISGVVGIFQNAKQETTLNAIEHEVRYSQIHLLAILETGVNVFMAELPSIRGLTQQFLDQHAWRIHDVWSVLTEIRDAAMIPSLVDPLLAGGGGNITVVVNLDGNEVGRALVNRSELAGGAIP